MTDTCARCDRGAHADCDGIATIIDQDGTSRYICECYCRREVNERRRLAERVDKVRSLMAALGIDRTHELIERGPRA